MKVNVSVNEPYKPLYQLPPETEIVFLMGGRGSGKTYEASKFTVFSAVVKGKRIQVLRDERSTVKESILNDILIHFDKTNANGVLDALGFARLENGIKNEKTGEMVVFTKGFRASTSDKKTNLKGVSNLDIGIIEEGEDVRDSSKFDTFHDSVRKDGSFLIFIMNTPDIHHFMVRRYYTSVAITEEDEPHLTAEERDGYFKLVPKNIKGFVSIQTTYKDNPHLPAKTVERYKAYGDPESHLYNLHHYLTAIQGYSTTGLKGQIFKRYEIITDEEYAALDYEEVYGMDFGTSSPTAIIGIKIRKNNIYIRELAYAPMSLRDMAFKLNDLGMTGDTLIIADCAAADMIRNLRFGLASQMTESEWEQYPEAAGGFRNMRPSPDKSIKAGLETLLGMRMHVTRSSENVLHELSMYVWATDRDGKALDKPIDDYNHAIDSIRYVAQALNRLHGRVEMEWDV